MCAFQRGRVCQPHVLETLPCLIIAVLLFLVRVFFLVLDQRCPLSTVYRAGFKRNSSDTTHPSDILTRLQEHDISSTSLTNLDMSCSFTENFGTAPRRRKSPLFDGDILTSPKKKAKESITSVDATPSVKQTTPQKTKFKDFAGRYR